MTGTSEGVLLAGTGEQGGGILVAADRSVAGPPVGPAERLVAQAIDLAVITGWAVAAAGAGLAARAGGYDFADPARADLFALATLVGPVTVTFAFQEASDRRATPGKRRRGMQVTDRYGGRLRKGRALARSVVKFAPWQVAHTAVFGLLAGSANPLLVALAVGAQLAVVASVVTMALDDHHRALHDLVAGTRVIKTHRGLSKGDMP